MPDDTPLEELQEAEAEERRPLIRRRVPREWEIVLMWALILFCIGRDTAQELLPGIGAVLGVSP